ncbi:MAG: DUF1844 domain-containing protein [Phycisphaerae bacterium]
MADDESKLHIDDDWKSEAAAEKERLAKKVEGEAARNRLPEASFLSLVELLAMQAMVGLGGIGPGGQEIPPNLDLAKHHIDLLDVLDAKTAGNLEPDEKRLLDSTLHQLRMVYVEAVRAGTPGAPPK